MSSSDVSAVVNFFSTAAEGFNTTLSSTITASATSVGLNSTSGLTNGAVFVGIIEPGQTAQQTFTGTVDVGGSQITNVKWIRGANVGHAGGVTIVDYVSGGSHNMTTAGILKQHTQTGVHTGITTDTIVTTGNATVGGNETVAGTLGVTGVLTPSGGLSAGSVNFATLLSTIFGGQVQTQVNAGTAGGTMSYVNLGGIKLLWIKTANKTVNANADTTYTFTLPTSFFTTTSANFTSVEGNTGSDLIVPFFQVATTTVTATVALREAANVGGTAAINLLIIGT